MARVVRFLGSSMFQGRLLAIAGTALLVGCFHHPKLDIERLPCTSDDNCPVGSRCDLQTSKCTTSGSSRFDGGSDAVANFGGEAGVLDTQATVDVSPLFDGAAPIDVPYLADAVADQSNQGGVDGPGASTYDAGSGGASDSPVDAPASDTPVASIDTADAAAGIGGSSGSGGVPGTGAGGTNSMGGTTAGDADLGGALGSGGASGGGGNSEDGGLGGVPGIGGAGGSQSGGSTGSSSAIDCGPLSNPVNGSVLFSSTSVGSKALYSCASGHAPSTATQRTCQADGQWSGDAPICIPVDCGAPDAPSNGAVFVPITTYGYSATYSCSSGFVLSAGSTRTCQADGQWSLPAPTCVCPDNGSDCSGSCHDLQTDSNNCGTCGTICSTASPSTAQCTLGRCVVTLASANQAGNIVLDATYAYYLGGGRTANIMKIPLGGGSASNVVTGAGNVGTFAIDASNVYWTDIGHNSIMKAPLLAGSATTFVPSQSSPYGIVLDANNAYWTTSLTPNGTVMRAGLIDGSPAPIAQDQAAATYLAVDGTNVYWTVFSGTIATVMKASKAGGDATPLATNQEGYSPVARAGYVYWANRNAGTIMRVSADGTGLTPIVSGQPEPETVAIDADAVYWTNYGTSGALMKMRLGGTTPEQLYSGNFSGLGIATDATSVYWTDGAFLKRITPK